jgi:hypothetical protein
VQSVGIKHRLRFLFAALFLGIAACLPAFSLAEPLAITFDDLPLNGTLAPNMTRTGIVGDVVAILKKRRAPQVYGFVNAKRFENNQDGAEEAFSGEILPEQWMDVRAVKSPPAPAKPYKELETICQ